MSISIDVYYKDANGALQKGSSTISLKQGFIDGINESRFILSATGYSNPCEIDITQQVNALLFGRRTSMPFEDWKQDGILRLDTKYTSGTALSCYISQDADSPALAHSPYSPDMPDYAPNIGTIADNDVCLIFDGVSTADGSLINLEPFQVDTLFWDGTLNIKAALTNTHPRGAVIKKINITDLRFLAHNAGLARYGGYKTQAERPAGLTADDIALSDGGSQTIQWTFTDNTAYTFTPYFDIYVRRRKFSFIEEWWEPDYDDTLAIHLKDMTLATLDAGDKIGTYGGGATAEGGPIVAGVWWVGFVTKDGYGTFNVNESLPVVKSVTVA